jgi:hypothetical protein
MHVPTFKLHCVRNGFTRRNGGTKTMAQTPPEVVRQFLANTTNPMIVKSLVAEDATYVSLNYDNPDLKKDYAVDRHFQGAAGIC